MKWLMFALGGAVIGLVSGFFGGGGGMICIPVLEHLLKTEPKESHATALLVILPISVMSGFVYAFCYGIELIPFGFVTLGVTLGGVIGALLLSKLKSKVIRAVFAGLLLFGGVWIISTSFLA